VPRHHRQQQGAGEADGGRIEAPPDPVGEVERQRGGERLQQSAQKVTGRAQIVVTGENCEDGAAGQAVEPFARRQHRRVRQVGKARVEAVRGPQLPVHQQRAEILHPVPLIPETAFVQPGNRQP